MYIQRHYDLSRQIIEITSYKELLKLYGWKANPLIDRPDLTTIRGFEDLNDRRLRDAESISTVVRNLKPKIIVEIGTGTGAGTVLLSKSSPKSDIYTINILPEEESRSGKFNTEMLTIKQIGQEYKKLHLRNIHQVYENSLTWKPSLEKIDFAFIDGAHDSINVYMDTIKMLNFMSGGSFILWHDFNPKLRKVYPWINEVMLGIEQCYSKGVLRNKILHIENSWVGIYKV